MQFQICFVNQSSYDTVDCDEHTALSEVRNKIGGKANGFLFLNIREQKPIHPSDESKMKLSEISINNFILMQLESDIPWPICETCHKITKEYGRIGQSMAQVEFNYEILVSFLIFTSFILTQIITLDTS